jgi:hypothetical protein
MRLSPARRSSSPSSSSSAAVRFFVATLSLGVATGSHNQSMLDALLADPRTEHFVQGSPECPCINASGALPTVDAGAGQGWNNGSQCVLRTVRSGDGSATICLPPGYGSSTCGQWDLHTDGLCSQQPLPEWCTAAWCYVDFDACRSSEADLTRSQYFTTTTLGTQPLYFSYSTCFIRGPHIQSTTKIPMPRHFFSQDYGQGRIFRVVIPILDCSHARSRTVTAPHAHRRVNDELPHAGVAGALRRSASRTAWQPERRALYCARIAARVRVLVCVWARVATDPTHYKRDPETGGIVVGAGAVYRNASIPFEGSMIDYLNSLLARHRSNIGGFEYYATRHTRDIHAPYTRHTPCTLRACTPTRPIPVPLRPTNATRPRVSVRAVRIVWATLPRTLALALTLSPHSPTARTLSTPSPSANPLHLPSANPLHLPSADPLHLPSADPLQVHMAEWRLAALRRFSMDWRSLRGGA